MKWLVEDRGVLMKFLRGAYDDSKFIISADGCGDFENKIRQIGKNESICIFMDLVPDNITTGVI